jgi:hypothetical protein
MAGSMTQNRNKVPGQQTSPAAPQVDGAPTRWRHIAADLTADALLVVAALLPWNLYFGAGIPNSNTTVFAVLIAVTVLSLIAVALPGSWRATAPLRFWLNVPYLLLVLAFVGFDAFETVRFGGTVAVPAGVGPGAWLGIAGSLLSAQPAAIGESTPDDTSARWLRAAQIIGYVSIVAAAGSFAFTLYWRVKYALPNADGSTDFGQQNIAVVATATVYGVVALIAVIVASRWMLRSTKASRLATVAMGASTLAAGIIVWELPVGRDIDAFHGIAQNTSMAGVGFEGYLAWAAAGAIFAPRALFRRSDTTASQENPWRTSARSGLLLIAVWCLGSLVMRTTDLAVALSLNYPYSGYDSMVMAAFDAVTAVLAIALRTNLTNESASAKLITSLCGLVATLSISRVIVGIGLAPTFLQPPIVGAQSPVYGNDLAQQITSTFDVTLSVLALCILAAAVITGYLSRRPPRRQKRARNRVAPPAAPQAPAATPTTRSHIGGPRCV